MIDGATSPTAAAAHIARATGVDRHDVAVVLGSGWTGAAEALGEPRATLAMADVPGFLAPVAPGHVGEIRSYQRGGARVLALLGRTHLYEGHGTDPVVHGVRTAAATGCRTLILTNASGSLRGDWPPGTGVLITDHLNLTAQSPLRGADFVDLTDLWSPRLREFAHAADPTLADGVYAMLPGPHYNTRAEAIMMRTMGAHLVGMSTVLEAIAARAVGLELLGISTITTQEIDGPPIDPDEVVAVAEASATRLGDVIAAVIDQLSPPTS